MNELKDLAEKCEDSSLTLLDELDGVDIIKRSLAKLLERTCELENDLKGQHPMVTLAFSSIRDDIHLICMASDYKTNQLADLAKKIATDTSELSLNMNLYTTDSEKK